MSGRGRRVLVYTASLLAAPLPAMPFARGTREFALGVMACGLVLTLSSLYVFRGEAAVRPRGLLGDKLLVTSLITMLLGLSLFLGSVACLGGT